MKMQPYSFRDFTKILKNNGYFEVRISGDHHIFKKDGVSDIITVSQKPNPCICRRLIKTYSLAVM